MERRRKIILDCDPGHDDAIAILLAAKNPKLELLGITTVKGNDRLELVTRNALDICQEIGVDVPVCRGMAAAMVQNECPVRFPQKVLLGGPTGMDGHTFTPLTKKLDPRHAVDFIIEALLASQEPVTLVPTGPLSNIGMAIRLEPRILEHIEEIVLMGGSYEHGNVTPAAEFNIISDAEAAHIVFTCGRPITMMGLDLTRQALCYQEIVERMAKIPTKGARLFVDLLTFFNTAQNEVFGWSGAPLHDPTTVAYLIDPSCIETKAMHVEIDLTGGMSHGRTNCDFFNLTGKPTNAKVGVKLHAEQFWDIVEEALRLCD